MAEEVALEAAFIQAWDEMQRHLADCPQCLAADHANQAFVVSIRSRNRSIYGLSTAEWAELKRIYMLFCPEGNRLTKVWNDIPYGPNR